MVWLYRRSPGIYRELRNTILATWLIAVPVFAPYPVAPPRLGGLGLVDTLSRQAAAGLTGRSTIFYTPLAAGDIQAGPVEKLPIEEEWITLPAAVGDARRGDHRPRAVREALHP